MIASERVGSHSWNSETESGERRQAWARSSGQGELHLSVFTAAERARAPWCSLLRLEFSAPPAAPPYYGSAPSYPAPAPHTLQQPAPMQWSAPQPFQQPPAPQQYAPVQPYVPTQPEYGRPPPQNMAPLPQHISRPQLPLSSSRCQCSNPLCHTACHSNRRCLMRRDRRRRFLPALARTPAQSEDVRLRLRPLKSSASPDRASVRAPQMPRSPCLLNTPRVRMAGCQANGTTPSSAPSSSIGGAVHPRPAAPTPGTAAARVAAPAAARQAAVWMYRCGNRTSLTRVVAQVHIVIDSMLCE